MTAALWLRNLASFATQGALLVAAGVMVWRVMRIRHAVATHAYWRTLLALCVLLPICLPWQVIEPPPLQAVTKIVAASNRLSPELPAAADVVPAPSRAWLTSELVVTAVVAGVVVRALWLLLGALSLRRLRRSAVLLDPVPASIRDAEAKVGTRAAVYVSDRVTGPITFGVRRPVVIVPPGVLEMDAELQEAIACHELVHVRRRDWLHVIGEELVRTVLWFHPAIWWLIGRIHLTREHIVDEAVIRLTTSRERYVEAMVAVALSRSALVPVPVPLFLRRRFLKRRVAHLLQETTMTTRRLIAAATVSATALAFTSVLAVRAFPLEARAPQRSAPKAAGTAPVEIAAGGEHLLHGGLPEYPHRAVEQRIEGEVVLDLTVDERGEVSDARVLSGPDALRRAALESVLQWHFSPDKVRSTSAQAVLRFTAPSDIALSEARREKGELVAALKIVEPEPREFAVSDRPHGNVVTFDQPVTKLQVDDGASRLQRQVVEVTRALEEQSLTDSQRAELVGKLDRVKHKIAEAREVELKEGEQLDKVSVETLHLSRLAAERVSPELLTMILNRAGAKVGDRVSEDLLKQIVAAAASVDEHFHVRWERDGKGGLIVFIIAP